MLALDGFTARDEKEAPSLGDAVADGWMLLGRSQGSRHLQLVRERKDLRKELVASRELSHLNIINEILGKKSETFAVKT